MSETDVQPERISGVVGDRIAGAVLLVLAVAAWSYSFNFTAGFMQPVGPGVFPRLVCVPLGVISLYLILRPGFNQRWPHRAALTRQGCALALLTSYGAFLEPWGFLPASLVTVILLIRLFGARWKPALVCGAVLTVGLYGLFEFALGMPLPNMPGLDW